MTNLGLSIDSRLWLATHLLYPNSSQAFDVYQSLMTQAGDSIRKNDRQFIFKKLDQIVEKIPAVSSNKAFHVFESSQTEQWQQIYRKSHKEQIIIFIGYFIFEFNLKEISRLLRLTFEKTQFLFHQTFKKSIFLNTKLELPEKIRFKKVNEERISFLFTNENLIDYCLGRLTPQEAQKVRRGLELYPSLQASHEQYELIVGQVQTLLEHQQSRTSNTFVETTEATASSSDFFDLRTLFVSQRKLLAAVSLSIVALVVLMVRPNWIQRLSRIEQEKYVTLQEVTPKPVINEEVGPATPTVVAAAPANTNQVPAPQVTAVAPSHLAVAPKPLLSAPVAPQPIERPVAVAAEGDEVGPTHAAAQGKKSGGLFRGVLTVTDIHEVTPKIKEKLVDIGGKKAGEVELGWRKSNNLSYFHFTLPENNVQAMKEFMSKFGTLEIQYENHPRLMPAGVKRLIIEVKERE